MYYIIVELFTICMLYYNLAIDMSSIWRLYHQVWIPGTKLIDLN